MNTKNYTNFTISGFSDEIDENVEKQFHHLNKLGISYFEPRGINGKNIGDLNEKEAHELKNIMDEYNIKVSSIGSPIGKININEDVQPHIDMLHRVISTAKILGTRYIRIFSFFIPQNDDYSIYRNEVIRRLRIMVDIAEKEDIILLHENEKEIYGDIASRCLEIITEIDSPNLKCVFDPANFVQCGQKVFPDAYEMLRPYIEYMHIKDANPDGMVVPSGYGIGGVRDILRSLKQSGYKGFVSIEPHLGNFTGLAELENSEKLNITENSSPEKFTLAYNALCDILDSI